MTKVKKNPYEPYRFLLQALDPIHVGTGGYRLGRVDLSIVREPGTNLPKLPGTGISGAARYYSALTYGKIVCAGQGIKDASGDGHCGDPQCPICYTFGSLNIKKGKETDKKGEETVAMAGTVRIFDARLLLFPVSSMAGPVWLTSPEVLSDVIANFKIDDLAKEVKANSQEIEVLAGNEFNGFEYLNLGWLMVKINPDHKKLDKLLEENEKWKDITSKLPEHVKPKIIVVPDSIFSLVVNSNLEVRTSVSIDPSTGAAREGALFTYEAIPRGTIFWLDVVENDYRNVNASDSPFPVKYKFKRNEIDTNEELPEPWNKPIDVVKTGLKMMEFLGVGGMNTRGFGRVKLLGSTPEVNEDAKS
ncbi:hypothetical protein ciss_05440 [Carboxydothermus islandicus]|uniref:CRISPR type III-associated protein domain-containing protein n=1 Tax=Carboxydothermus islandicus TaxID=661089 RepID=A0A1L8D0I0_9THEO|nr:type III-B CRISPR module RAMP protein Cmr4 [Carboxydothermus islandicus]GAV24611.1 hypothetical protein ciss_05440 [Carboxydothermus islandicus]